MSFTATDIAGNTAGTSLSLSLDKTAPVLTGTLFPLPNINAWNNADVVVSFAATGDLSGIIDISDPLTLSQLAIFLKADRIRRFQFIKLRKIKKPDTDY